MAAARRRTTITTEAPAQVAARMVAGPRNVILQGDARDVLATLPDECVQCVVTSPPYWALRRYNTAPQIWDGDPLCEHVWGEEARAPWANSLPGPNGRRKNVAATRERERRTGPFCARCEAWRGELGSEPTVDLYIAHVVEVFRAVRRVLRSDGVCWLNISDSYNGAGYSNHANTGGTQRAQGGKQHHASSSGMKQKDLCLIPQRLAIALQADGWWVRMDCVWEKPNPLPESVTDRPTRAHEYLYLLSKSATYYYDADAIREPSQPEKAPGRNSSCINDKTPVSHKKHMKVVPLIGAHGTAAHDGNGLRYERVYNHPLGRNKRSVWTIATEPFPGAHFAVMPEALVEPCILAGSQPGDVILDPFIGSGTVAVVAQRLDRDYLGVELNPSYAAMAERRILTAGCAHTRLADVDISDDEDAPRQAPLFGERAGLEGTG